MLLQIIIFKWVYILVYMYLRIHAFINIQKGGPIKCFLNSSNPNTFCLYIVYQNARFADIFTVVCIRYQPVVFFNLKTLIATTANDTSKYFSFYTFSVKITKSILECLLLQFTKHLRVNNFWMLYNRQRRHRPRYILMTSSAWLTKSAGLNECQCQKWFDISN